MNATSFWQDTVTYALRMRQFSTLDWKVYVAWVGMMLGLLFSVSFFLFCGHRAGVVYPSYVWNIPVGIFIFVTAIAFDTIGHRTAYKGEIAKGENLVHHITIFAGITSILLLCLAYHFPDALRIPALVFVALSIFYSIVDEALHWHRYLNLHSDRVEMWSHFFIFVGHIIMTIAWWHWFQEGYPGVAETIPHLPLI
jgi:hypothetical protein